MGNLPRLIERRATGSSRLQDRFSASPSTAKNLPLFRQALAVGHEVIYREVPYGVDSRARDAWLLSLSRMGALIDGVIYSMTQRDASRGYAMVGPVSTVLRVRNILHTADRGAGWREHVARLATSYYCTDMGALPQWYVDGSVTVSDDDGQVDVVRPPLRAIFHYDPTQCSLTGNWERPVRYYGDDKARDLVYGTVGRFCSMPVLESKYNGLGWCFMSRVTQVLRLLFAAIFGMQELMDARVPQGFLFISGLTRNEIEDAMGGYEALLEQFRREHFGATLILANDTGQPVGGEFLQVSQFPEGFNLREFVDLLMLGIALAAGLPASDLWDVNTGRGFGREGENRESFRRAGSKGRNAFALAHQEKLQQVLPGSVSFQYERHNADERMIEAAAAKAWLEVGVLQQQLGVPAEVYLSHMIDAGAISPEATEAVEDSIVTDVGELKEAEPDAAARTILRRDTQMKRHRASVLENPAHLDTIMHARSTHDRDPIVHLSVDDTGQERCLPLWESADAALRRTMFAAAAIVRQHESLEEIYEARWRDLVRAAEANTVDGNEAQDELEALVVATLLALFLRDTGDTDSDEYSAALAVVSGNYTMSDSATVARAVSDVPESVSGIITAEQQGVVDSSLMIDITSGDLTGAEARWPLWESVLTVGTTLAALAMAGAARLRWQIDPLKESCESCIALNGQVHSADTWLASGIMPQRTILDCFGRYCGCQLIATEDEERGDLAAVPLRS